MNSENRRTRRAFGNESLVILVIIAIGLSTWMPGLTPPAEATALTMTGAVKQALSNNHVIAAKQYAQTAAIWAHRQARSQLLPKLSLQSSYTRLDDGTVERANAFGREFTMFIPDGEGGFETLSLSIPQTIFRDGFETQITAEMLLFHPQVWNGMSQASSARNIAAWQEVATIQETVHQTLRSCLDLLKTKSLLEIRQKHLEQARDNTALAERLFDVGRYSEADILQWRVEEMRQQGLLTQGKSDRSILAMNLENLMGANPTGLIELDAELPIKISGQIEYFRELGPTGWEFFLQQPLAQIIADNPNLEILAGSLNMADLEHRRSKYNYVPSISLNGSYGWQHNDSIDLDGDKTWSANVTFSLPLFTSFSNYSELQMTKHKVLQTQQENEEAQRALILSGEVARTAIHSNSELLQLAETSLESSKRNLEIMHSNYTLGRLTNLEWIQANLNVQQAEQVYSSAYFDLAIAITDYFQAQGKIAELIAQ